MSEYICTYLKISLDDTQETGSIACGGEELGSGTSGVRDVLMFTLCYLLNFEPLGYYLFLKINYI